MRARGQTLVIGVLTLLLLALMVMITLSIAWRVRDRIEAQVTADAAAYSEAVELARTYNEIALMTRVQIGLLASVASMSSLVSWSSHYYSNLVAARKAMEQIHGVYVATCNPLLNPCPCTQIGPSQASLSALQLRETTV